MKQVNLLILGEDQQFARPNT